MGTLDRHRVVVTGGGSGIGAAICRRFASHGARVAVLDRDGNAASLVASSIDAIAVECDVTSSASVDGAIDAAWEQLGGITDLVNNAGIGMNKPLHRYRDDEWALVVGVNLTGTFHCMRAVIPRMLDAGGGSIVNNASFNAVRPLSGEAPYSAAKAAVVNLTVTAALEYAPSIRVNCVSPGLIETPLTELVTSNREWRSAAEAATPLQRIGSADDVAAVIEFLCSDAAAYVTGQNVVVDGGAGLPNAQAESLIKTIMSNR